MRHNTILKIKPINFIQQLKNMQMKPQKHHKMPIKILQIADIET